MKSLALILLAAFIGTSAALECYVGETTYGSMPYTRKCPAGTDTCAGWYDRADNNVTDYRTSSFHSCVTLANTPQCVVGLSCLTVSNTSTYYCCQTDSCNKIVQLNTGTMPGTSRRRCYVGSDDYGQPRATNCAESKRSCAIYKDQTTNVTHWTCVASSESKCNSTSIAVSGTSTTAYLCCGTNHCNVASLAGSSGSAGASTGTTTPEPTSEGEGEPSAATFSHPLAFLVQAALVMAVSLL